MHFTILFKTLCIMLCLTNSETKQIVNYGLHNGQQIKTTGKQIGSEIVRSVIECASICSSRHECCTANYDNVTQLCALITDCCPETEEYKSGTFISGKFEMPVPQDKPKDCSEIPAGSSNGVYKIYPESSSGFDVYCNDGWTVIQRREDGTVDFYRPWADYKTGFGDVSGNFWLGNDKIHILTSTKRYQLRIELTDFSESKAYAVHNSFSVGDEASKYALSVCGYSGTAGDALTKINGTLFTTKDQDNDIQGFNCAHSFKGGWWYRKCGIANLNGMYLPGQVKWYSMFWRPWHGETCLKTSLMMIR